MPGKKAEIFDDFIERWGDKFTDLILDSDNTKEQFEIQEEWVWLVSRFESEIEKDFFKPYWVPTKPDSLDFFIDLSDEYPTEFEAHYMFYEPYEWYKIYPNSVFDPELAHDAVVAKTKDDILTFHEANSLHSRKRLKLGMEGKIKLSERDPDEYFDDTSNFVIKKNNDAIIVHGLTIKAIELIPNQIEIEVCSLNDINEYEFYIKNIHALCFLFQATPYNFTKVQFELKSPYSGLVSFDSDMLILDNLGYGIAEITEGRILDEKDKYEEQKQNKPEHINALFDSNITENESDWLNDFDGFEID
jgi:hypothetical protein